MVVPFYDPHHYITLEINVPKLLFSPPEGFLTTAELTKGETVNYSDPIYCNCDVGSCEVF